MKMQRKKNFVSGLKNSSNIEYRAFSKFDRIGGQIMASKKSGMVNS
jgi:hypothetical protein